MGARSECESIAGVKVQFAPSADNWIVGEVERRTHASAGELRTIVVSADRALQDRARHRGAEKLSPWAFARMCKASRTNRARHATDVE